MCADKDYMRDKVRTCALKIEHARQNAYMRAREYIMRVEWQRCAAERKDAH